MKRNQGKKPVEIVRISKPVLPSESFIPRLERIRAGMATHQDEKATVAAIEKLLDDRMISTLLYPDAKRARNTFALFFIHESKAVCEFARRRFREAIDGFVSKGLDHEFRNHIGDVLYHSDHRKNPEIYKVIGETVPVGWKPQARLAEEAVAA